MFTIRQAHTFIYYSYTVRGNVNLSNRMEKWKFGARKSNQRHIVVGLTFPILCVIWNLLSCTLFPQMYFVLVQCTHTEFREMWLRDPNTSTNINTGFWLLCRKEENEGYKLARSTCLANTCSHNATTVAIVTSLTTLQYSYARTVRLFPIWILLSRWW